METSAVAEHAWENHHPIDWEETTDSAGPWQRTGAVGEGSPAHPDDTLRGERFNRDGGLELPGCWTAVMRKQGGWSNPHRPLTSSDVYPQ